MAASLIMGQYDNIIMGKVLLLSEAVATLQSHDAITGSHATRVNGDFIQIMLRGIDECQKVHNHFFRYYIDIYTRYIKNLV